MRTTIIDFDTALLDAVTCYTDRKNRTTHPDGSTDNGGRWYPDASERQDCCAHVRSPSRSYPWSLMLHCRTAGHIAALYGVDETALRRAVRQQTPKRTVQKVTRYKIVRVSTGPETDECTYHSLYDPAQTYALQTTYRQAAKDDHRGGYYVRELEWWDDGRNHELAYVKRTLEQAFRTGQVYGSPAPGTYAILACEVWGTCITYDNGKQAWTYLRPTSVHSTFVVA
jgi:hypothetical protein